MATDDDDDVYDYDVFKLQNHSLRLSASRIAAMVGLHPYYTLPDLVMQLVYQGRHGQRLLRHDTSLLGIEIQTEERMLLQLASKASTSTARAVQEALLVKKGKRKLSTIDKAHSIKQHILQTAKQSKNLSSQELSVLQEGIRSSVDTGFGTVHEDEALNVYEQQCGWHVRHRNTTIMAWPFVIRNKTETEKEKEDDEDDCCNNKQHHHQHDNHDTGTDDNDNDDGTTRILSDTRTRTAQQRQASLSLSSQRHDVVASTTTIPTVVPLCNAFPIQQQSISSTSSSYRTLKKSNNRRHKNTVIITTNNTTKNNNTTKTNVGNSNDDDDDNNFTTSTSSTTSTKEEDRKDIVGTNESTCIHLLDDDEEKQEQHIMTGRMVVDDGEDRKELLQCNHDSDDGHDSKNIVVNDESAMPLVMLDNDNNPQLGCPDTVSRKEKETTGPDQEERHDGGNDQRSRSKNEQSHRQKPFFTIYGSVDGIRDELWCPPSATAGTDKTHGNNKTDAVSSALNEEWTLRQIIVECKHRMKPTTTSFQRRAVHASPPPPPLYDQIQAVAYCLMYNVSEADIVQVMRKPRQQQQSQSSTSSSVDSCKMRKLESKQQRNTGTTTGSDDNDVVVVENESNKSNRDDRAVLAVKNGENAAPIENKTLFNADRDESSRDSPNSINQMQSKAVQLQSDNPVRSTNFQEEIDVDEAISKQMKSNGSSIAEKRSEEVAQEIRVDTSDHGCLTGPSANGSLSSSTTAIESTTVAPRDKNTKQRCRNGADAKSQSATAIEINVQRVSLDDPVMQHRRNWYEIVLPRLRSFVDAVYRIRADDGRRYRLLTSMSDVTSGNLNEAWNVLHEECPWLKDCDTAFRRSY